MCPQAMSAGLTVPCAVNTRLPEQRELQQASGQRSLRGDCRKGSQTLHIRLHGAPCSEELRVNVVALVAADLA